jgi:hypothetical protein
MGQQSWPLESDLLLVFIADKAAAAGSTWTALFESIMQRIVYCLLDSFRRTQSSLNFFARWCRAWLLVTVSRLACRGWGAGDGRE